MAEVKKPVAVAKKAEVKKEEVKAAPAAVKAEVKKPAAAPKAVAKKAPAKKAEPAKKAAPKAETKKAAAPAKKEEVKASLFVQFQGRDYAEETLIKMAKESYKATGKKEALKTLNVYANVDDQVAYYVANGSFEGKFDI